MKAEQARGTGGDQGDDQRVEALELGIQEPVGSVIAGIEANISLGDVAEPIARTAQVCEVIGLAVGVATGLHPLALAYTKVIIHDQVDKIVTEKLTDALKSLIPGAPRDPDTKKSM